MVGAGDRSLIFTGSGTLLAELMGTTCCGAPSLSADGTLALVRRDASVVLYEWDGSTYREAWSGNAGPGASMREAISPDGSTIASYSRDFVVSNGMLTCGNNTLHVYRFATTLGFLTVNSHATYTNYGTHACAGDLDFSYDGSRLAVATWGTLESQVGADDVLHDVATVLDTTTPGTLVPIYRLIDDIDETGSAERTAISDDGKRVVFGVRCHANTLCWGPAKVWAIELLV